MFPYCCVAVPVHGAGMGTHSEELQSLCGIWILRAVRMVVCEDLIEDIRVPEAIVDRRRCVLVIAIN
jgi:hypothetical protein